MHTGDLNSVSHIFVTSILHMDPYPQVLEMKLFLFTTQQLCFLDFTEWATAHFQLSALQLPHPHPTVSGYECKRKY